MFKSLFKYMRKIGRSNIGTINKLILKKKGKLISK